MAGPELGFEKVGVPEVGHYEAMRRAAAVVPLLALMLAGCGPEQAAPTVVPAPAPVVTREAAICEQIRAQMDVNQRLHADGYANDYGDQYRSLLRAQGCAEG